MVCVTTIYIVCILSFVTKLCCGVCNFLIRLYPIRKHVHARWRGRLQPEEQHAVRLAESPAADIPRGTGRLFFHRPGGHRKRQVVEYPFLCLLLILFAGAKQRNLSFILELGFWFELEEDLAHK